MAKHQKTVAIIEAARAILAESQTAMTVRQVYYQLVSRQVIENNRGQYQAVSNALVDARKEGAIPWDRIEDRLRRPRSVAMWDGLADFAQTAVAAYRRDVWADQAQLVEVWLEKDALSGIFEDALAPYGVTLNVGRGYDGWDSIYNAAQRYKALGKPVTILYFGDLDPSGRDIVRSLGERLAFFETSPEIEICALLPEDIARYHLPPDFAKTTDTRRAGFVATYGDAVVELDALPSDVLRSRLAEAVRARLDLGALASVHRLEGQERRRLAQALAA